MSAQVLLTQYLTEKNKKRPRTKKLKLSCEEEAVKSGQLTAKKGNLDFVFFLYTNHQSCRCSLITNFTKKVLTFSSVIQSISNTKIFFKTFLKLELINYRKQYFAWFNPKCHTKMAFNYMQKKWKALNFIVSLTGNVSNEHNCFHNYSKTKTWSLCSIHVTTQLEFMHWKMYIATKNTPLNP